LGNEYSRTIEPARAIATETLTLTRTLSDLVNHACAGNDEPRLPGLRAFKYCVVFRVALYNLKDTGDFYERVKAHSRGQLMRLSYWALQMIALGIRSAGQCKRTG
jgi:hypothetical protein